MRKKIIDEIIRDLADNYNNDSYVLSDILEDMIMSALSISNRRVDTEKNIEILKDNIKKATKTIYLRRGTEDVVSSSQSGLNNVYDNAIETMKKDIISQNKRVLI